MLLLDKKDYRKIKIEKKILLYNYLKKSNYIIKMCIQDNKNLAFDKNMSIQSILKDTQTRENYHTHVSMGNFKSKYCFSRRHLEDFFNNYNADKDNLCLAEKPQHQIPVIVDIDIKRIKQENLAKRTNKHITDVIKVYQKVLKLILNDDLPNEYLNCVFLDKNPYEITQNNKTYIKNGFHLHFPYIFMTKIEMEVHLLPRVKQEINNLQTFKDLGFDKSSSLIDDITSNAWLIYGAKKDETMDAYKVKKVFNHNCQEIELEKAFENYRIYDMKEQPIDIKGNVEKYLPRILSIIPYGRPTQELKHGLMSLKTVKEKQKQKRTKAYDKKPNKQLLKEAQKLVKILNNSRADDRTDWLKVGWILYNISQGSEDGFQIWNEFSSRCIDKYDEVICEHHWDKMTENTELTIGTLHYYAKQDNPKEYKNFILENNENILYQTLESSHYDVAELFQKVYGYDNVKITSQKDLTCFIWNENSKLWVESTKQSLAKKLSDIITPIYIKAGKKLLEQLQDCEDKADKEKWNSKNKKIQKMILNLKSSPYINNTLKALAGYDIEENFETKIINKKPNELPIQNGKIIDFKTLEIRDRTLNDYWSFECDVNFLGEKADLSCVEKFFNDISCGSPNLVDYHRRLWGYLLTGEVSDRSLHIFWGAGCNGKSSIVNIFSNITKKFTVALNEDVMLKKTSRGANPEMMPLLTARCGSLPESDKREELNSKRVKTITGDDVINARHLFGHAVSFKTQCKPIWATNHKPKINIDDKAILDRLKLIPFLACFDKTQENTDYIKDLQENKLNQFFTWFCLGAYDWYNGQELIPCKEMTEEMNKYISENDVVSEFINDTYELITREEYDKLPKLEKSLWVQNRTFAYPEFMAWIQDNNRKDDSLGKKDFNTQLEKKVKTIRTRKIKNGFLAKKKDYEEEPPLYNEGPPL